MNGKKDGKFGTVAFKSNPDSPEHADDELKGDLNFIQELIKIDTSALRYASTRLKSDKNLAVKALAKYYNCLELVAKEIRQNLGFMIKAAE